MLRTCGWLVLLGTFIGCVDLRNKHACNSDDDCNGVRVCKAGQCMDPCYPSRTSCPATAACGLVSDGCDYTIDCGECELLAIEPQLARTNDVITLEGTFGEGPPVVHFPGGAAIPAFAGKHRAHVEVPASATAGPLYVETGQRMVGPLPFRRVEFALGVEQSHTAASWQLNYGRQATHLLVPRAHAASVALAGRVYVIGGLTPQGAVRDVEVATINGDSTLGPFASASASNLVAPRHHHRALLIGGAIYVVGGQDANNAHVSTVERAELAGATLGSFTVVGDGFPDGAAPALVGNALHALGGTDGVAVARATITPDGLVGEFHSLPDLQASRSEGVALSVDGQLALLAGSDGSGALATVENLDFDDDGQLIGSSIAALTVEAPGRAPSAIALGTKRLLLPGAGAAALGRPLVGEVTGRELGSFTALDAATLAARRVASGLVLAGNRVYVLGGAAADGTPLADVDWMGFDQDAGLLEPGIGQFGNVLPGPSFNHGAIAVAGDHLYLLGGQVGSHTGASSVTWDVQVAAIAADGQLGPFQSLEGQGIHLVDGATQHSSAVIGDWIYVFGGQSSSSGAASSTVQRARLDPDGNIQGSFQTEGLPHTSQLCLLRSAVVIGHRLYLLGCFTDTNAKTTDSEWAPIGDNGDLGEFQPLPPDFLPEGRASIHTPVSRGRLYLIGGFMQSGDPPLWSAPIAPDDTIGSFTKLEDITGSRLSHQPMATALGESMYLFGGTPDNMLDDSTALVHRVPFRADGTLATIFAFGDSLQLPDKRNGGVAIALGDYVHVVGGVAVQDEPYTTDYLPPIAMATRR